MKIDLKAFAANASARLRLIAGDRQVWWCLLSVVFIAVVAFVYFYPDAAEGNVLRQYDVQQGIAVGQEAKAFTEATGQTTRWTGSLFSGMPNFQISPDYPSNHLFSWLDKVMGLGLPSPANLMAMMMIGFFILLLAMKLRWWVALIGAIGYGFSTYFLIIINAGHIWKFITLAYIPPTIAGMVLAYRGRYLAGGALAALFAMLQIAANHVQMSYYFLAVVVGLAVAYLIIDLKRKNARNWVVATGTLAVAAVLAVAANSPGLYNTYEYSKETMRGRHSELTRQDDNAGTTAGLDRDYITQYSYMPSETFSLLIPNVKGGASARPEQGSVKMMTLADLPEAGEMADAGKIDSVEMQYLSYMSQYFGDPEGTNGPVYVGALIFALFMLGVIIVRGPVKWALVVLTLLSIFLAWGKHMMWFTDLFITYVPMYSKFRTVESILVIAGFTMPLLAAMALQKLVDVSPEDGLKRYRKPLLWSFGIAMFFCLVGILWPGAFGSLVSENDRMIDGMITEQLMSQGYDYATARAFSLESPRIYAAVTGLRESLVEADALRSFIIVGLGLCVIMLMLMRKIGRTVAVVAVGVLVCGDLFMVNKRYLNHDCFLPRHLNTGAPVAMTDVDRAILADTAMNYRVMDIPRFDSPAPSYYHKMIGGYHAAKLTRYQDLIDCHLGNFRSGEPTEADMRVLDMLNARYIVDFDGNVTLNPGALGNAWFVDEVQYVTDADNEMAALDVIDPGRVAVADKKFVKVLGTVKSAPAPGDTIFETSYAPNRLTYHVSSASGGVAVFSEIYFPWGWHATVDGKPAGLARVDYVLRAMKIPAGSHTVEMWFDPESLHVTDRLARIAIILIYLALGGAVIVSLCGRKRPAEA